MRGFAGKEGSPSCVAGLSREVLQSIVMLLRQLNENRKEVENQYKTRCPLGRETRASRPWRSICVASWFEWRGLVHFESALRHSRELCGVGRPNRKNCPGRA